MLGSFPIRLGGEPTPHEGWTKFFQDALGDAFTKEQISIVGAETYALAGALQLANQTCEKIITNSKPGTASDALVKWANRLGVTILPDDTEASLRLRCAVKYMSSGGNTEGATLDLIAALLGSAFVTIHFNKGDDPDDISSEPDGVVWDLGNSLAPATYDLFALPRDDNDPMDEGTEVWTSPAASIIVEVTQPDNMSSDDFLKLVNVDLYNLLDGVLPAWATWHWVVGDDGFILDEDLLDFNGLG